MPESPANGSHLSTLEQISPQAYTRFILCFGFGSGALHEDAAQILRRGLEAAAAEIPILKNIVVSVDDSRGRKTKGVRKDDVALFTVKDLTHDGLDFGNIQSQGFPSKVFDGELLCPTGVFAVPGSSVPVFLAQANLINGGLLLGVSVWHGAFDATAITTILRLWAQNCRAVEDPKSEDRDRFSLSAEAFDTSRLSKTSSVGRVSVDDHPEFMLLPETATTLPPALTQTIMTQIFHISSTSISALKEVADPRHSSSPQSEYSWVSTNIAVSALVWRSIMVATYAHEHPVTDSVSSFCSPVDARRRVDPRLANDLLASAWCFQDSRLPIKTLIEANLADVALVVRKATDKIDASYIDSLIGLIDGVPNPSLLMPLAFTDVLKTCSLLTSWAGFDMYGFDWGSALGGKCERVRTVASGMFNGMTVVLPELTREMGGGLEVVIGLEDEVMERLKSDEVWMRYARLL